MTVYNGNICVSLLRRDRKQTSNDRSNYRKFKRFDRGTPSSHGGVMTSQVRVPIECTAPWLRTEKQRPDKRRPGRNESHIVICGICGTHRWPRRGIIWWIGQYRYSMKPSVCSRALVVVNSVDASFTQAMMLSYCQLC